MQIEAVFEFLRELKYRNYDHAAQDKLLKVFFKNNLTRRGLRKTDIETFGNEAQAFLSFLLCGNKKSSSIEKRSLTNPCSSLYDDNDLDFNLVLQHWETREEWIIGEGEREIKIIKTAKEYILPKDKQSEQHPGDQLDDDWKDLLA